MIHELPSSWPILTIVLEAEFDEINYRATVFVLVQRSPIYAPLHHRLEHALFRVFICTKRKVDSEQHVSYYADGPDVAGKSVIRL